MAAMAAFLDDFERGKAEERYIDAELPSLPFADNAFDLALCSHFLFLYTTQLGEPFHHDGIRELCRVAKDVRVFPLLALGGARSPFVDSVVERLRADGFRVSVEKAPYEFQKGGDQLLRIRSSS